MSLFEITYELAKDPPPAMGWEDYERVSTDQWQRLIDGPLANDEAAIHYFLEQNPSFVPGAYGFPPSGHGPVFSGLFSRPELSGIGKRIPDFMWLATASDSLFPVFIEIETPAKKWFTEAGDPRSEFMHARRQLVDWKSWLAKPANRLVFLERYGLQSYASDFEFEPQFILIYGRRQEFEERPGLRGTRVNQEGDSEYHITFDRLRPAYDARDFLTIRDRGGEIEAVTFPPTVKLGPNIAASWLRVRGRAEAALRESRMSLERRQFVAQRLPYWDNWAATGRTSRGGDCE